MKKTKEIYMYALGALIVLAFFTTVYMLINVSMPESNENMLYILIGMLSAKFSDVVSYFYGSSKGSADKQNIIRDFKTKMIDDSTGNLSNKED